MIARVKKIIDVVKKKTKKLISIDKKYGNLKKIVIMQLGVSILEKCT